MDLGKMLSLVQRKRPARAATHLVLLWWLLVATGPGAWDGWASELLANTSDYTIENWQLEQGLPQISITSIAQTLDGYLWLGTFNGLARFDGVRFTIFDEGNTPALGNSAVTHLQVDAQGALWIVTLAGRLVRMAGGQFTVALQENARLLLDGAGFPDDSSHRLFLLDRQGGWRQIENDQLAPLDRPERNAVNEAPGFLFENSCLAWVARRGDISQSQKTTFPVSTGEGGDSNRIALTIYAAGASRAGGYWVATSNDVYRLRQGQLSTRVAHLTSVGRDQLCMKEDGQGCLWIAKWGEGLFRLDGQGAWRRFGAGTGLADNFVNCLYCDREGSLWVGTGQGGLHRIRPRVFQMYDAESGPHVVMSVTQDRQGRMWFGVNGGGLHTWTTGKLRPVTEPALLRAYELTYSVLADRQDAVWVGLYGITALRWHAGTVTSYDLSEGSSLAMTPHALFEDRAGTIWLGCTHGLLRYENGHFTRYSSREGLSSDTVVALAEDRSGTLYAGTDGGGLNRLRQGRFTCYTERDGLADNHLASLYVDKEDTLWMGTVNGGLGRFKDGRFATVGLKDDLPTATIGTLLEDDLGNLWLGSNRGIIRVSRSALNDYLDGKRGSLAWRVFGPSDGLSTLGCGGASQPASCKARDGKLWFATIKGVAVVDPNHLPRNPFPPPVVIEEAVLDDQVRTLPAAASRPDAPCSAGAEVPAAANSPPGLSSSSRVPSLTVPPRTLRVEFRFTALSLMAPEKARFRYRLEPFDRDWIQAGTRRIAYYTGIPPGRYQLRVTACNNDGVWNETGATLGLVVLPPWWMTWWFRGLALISAAGLLFGGYELRLGRLRRERAAQENFSRQLIALQESERQRLAGELHDGMGQDLLVIASQAQLSLSREENSPGAAARLGDIAETAKHALQQARRMAHNLRPGLLEELGFTKAVQATLEKAAQVSGISMAVALDDVDGLLPPEFEVNLFRITQETLNNLLKHAGASEAKITLTKEPRGLCLVVEDNGRGFEPSRRESAPPDQRGFGLRQIAERAKMMGGQFEIQSQPGRGARLTVHVPLRGSQFRA